MGRLYVRFLMIVLLSMAIFLLVTADNQREVVEAVVMAIIVTVFPMALSNAVPTYWVLVGDEGLQIQNKTLGCINVPWQTIKETRLQKTIMKGPFGPFYEEAPTSVLMNTEVFMAYMTSDHWSIVLITENRWLTIDGRDFDSPSDAGRVLGSRLLTERLCSCINV